MASLSDANKCSWHIIFTYARFVDYREPHGFTKEVIKSVGKPYSKFIDVGLPKSRFSLRILGSAKEGCVKRPAIEHVFNRLEYYLVQPKSYCSEIWLRTFSDEKPTEAGWKCVD